MFFFQTLFSVFSFGPNTNSGFVQHDWVDICLSVSLFVQPGRVDVLNPSWEVLLLLKHCLVLPANDSLQTYSQLLIAQNLISGHILLVKTAAANMV